MTTPARLNRDKVHADAKKNARFWRPKEGKNEVRFLMIGDTGAFYVKGYQHFGIGAGQKSIFCPMLTEDRGEKCAVCTYSTELLKSKDKDEHEEGYQLRAKVQFFSPMIDRQDTEKGVQLFAYGTQLMDSIWNAIETLADAGDDDPFAAVDGHGIYIHKEKTGPDPRNVKYSASPVIKKTTIPDMTWLDAAIEQTADLVQFTPYDKVVAMLGLADEDEDDEEEEEVRAPKRAVKIKSPYTATSSAATSSDDDNEEDDEDGEDEEEQDATAAAPTARSRSSRTSTGAHSKTATPSMGQASSDVKSRLSEKLRASRAG